MTNKELIDKIRQEIERLTNNAHEMPDGAKDKDYYLGKDNAYAELLSFLDSLSVDAPEGLDEAAENAWSLYEYRESPKGLYSSCFVDGFKAGAECAFGQGHTFTQPVLTNGMGQTYVTFKFVYCESEVEEGEEVIVQIRKK